MVRLAIAIAVVTLATIALLLPRTAQGDDKAIHDGTVQTVTRDRLTILDKSGKQKTFDVGKGVQIVIHGKDAKLEDLKSGTLVRVTTGLNEEVASIITVEPLMSFARGAVALALPVGQ